MLLAKLSPELSATLKGAPEEYQTVSVRTEKGDEVGTARIFGDGRIEIDLQDEAQEDVVRWLNGGRQVFPTHELIESPKRYRVVDELMSSVEAAERAENVELLSEIKRFNQKIKELYSVPHGQSARSIRVANASPAFIEALLGAGYDVSDHMGFTLIKW